MLRLTHLTKSFGSLTAVDDLSLEIKEGEIFGFLGPNGAGKSTVVNMATGRLGPDQGTISIGDFGAPTEAATRFHIGIAPQQLSLYDELTARENLVFFGSIYGLQGEALQKQVDWALEFVNIRDRENDPLHQFSGGMMRRVNLAAAILHEPKLLLLDEPTVGVDPQSRNAILERIQDMRTRGCTIVYTSHYMEEVERICDRIGIIDHGKLLTLGTVEEILAQHGQTHKVVATTQSGEEHFDVTDPAEALRALARVPELLEFRTEKPTLETVFLNLTGRSLRDV